MSKRKIADLDSIIYYYLFDNDYLKTAKSLLKETNQESLPRVTTTIESLLESQKLDHTQQSTPQESPEKRGRIESNSKAEGNRGKSNSPFRRVDADLWMKEIKNGLENNSYIQAFGEAGYGAKANKVLATVKGKDFRHEKTKRKRSTYRGGQITMESNSFKYADN